MSNTLNSISNFIRSVVSLAVLGAVAVAGWFGYQTVNSKATLEAALRDKNVQVEKLNEELAAKDKRLQELDLANRLLKQDHRLAKISVVKQWESTDTKRPVTEILFVDIDDQNNALDQPRKFTIVGDVLYIDSWVVKYMDELVESGDPLRGTSVCLFRRLYGEYQEPSDGFSLDPVNARPVAYDRGSQMTDLERDVWKHFWEYANDPEKAHKAGIRAAHGNAPFIKLQPGKSYVIEQRATGDLTIKTEEEAARDRGNL
jgi:hypothetical protein